MGRKEKPEAEVPETGSRRASGPEPEQSAGDIDLALKIGTYMESLPAHQSAPATQIAEALHGRDYTLAQVVDIRRVCEELREARILIRSRDGYGYRLSCLRTMRTFE
jgi:hypothetical protein